MTVFHQEGASSAGMEAAGSPVHASAGSGDLFQPGDVLGGRYEVLKRLGKGGFGLVYLAFCREMGIILALKTLRDERMADPAAREVFRREALIWVGLGEHPCVLTARWVEIFSSRPFVATDFVAPDDQGRVSLADHLLRARGPLDLAQSLRWAIQFCFGMEHANAHGVRCHLDIKPANILIMPDRQLKITDFGLARVGVEPGLDGPALLCGTPGYIAPEVYCGADGDVRSDVYAFGLVLWQMAVGSLLPPFAGAAAEAKDPNDWLAWQDAVWHRQVRELPPPSGGPLDGVIRRCLSLDPSGRFGDFAELRTALSALLWERVGSLEAIVEYATRDGAFWNNQGRSRCLLGRYAEALDCFDKSLGRQPGQADAWNNKGSALRALGRLAEACACFEKALALDPRLSQAWGNLGCVRHDQGRTAEALEAFDRAVEADPGNVYSWNQKGVTEMTLGRLGEAVSCFDKVLQLDPRDVTACNNRAHVLIRMGRCEDAIRSCDQALGVDPLCATAWYNKALALAHVGRFEDGVSCGAKAAESDPRLVGAWVVSGHCLRRAGRLEDALRCVEEAVALAPGDAAVWYEKGCVLADQARFSEAGAAFEKAVLIDANYAAAWFKLAETRQESSCKGAAAAWDRYLSLASGDASQREWVEKAREMVKKTG